MGVKPPPKRSKVDGTEKVIRKLLTVDEIQAGLHTQGQDGLAEVLTGLRNQFSIRPGEGTIAPQDERLLLAQQWLKNVTGAHEIFKIWDNTTQGSLLLLILSLLSTLLTLLSYHYTFHALGLPIIKILLTPSYIRRLNTYIGGSHSELILITFKLLNTMATFASGRENKSVLEGFAWETKSLPKILNMRRKTKGNQNIDSLIRPDIRTLYILFILSFVDPHNPSQTKTLFLEQHRDVFLSIFKGISQDSFLVAKKILEVCWSGIWSDPKIKKTIKIGLFSEITISHIAKLYDRTVPEDEEGEHIPANLVHHFLLAICTRPGTGICFRDRGWYPRETDDDDQLGKDDGEDVKQKGGKVYNKILANILKNLKINEDARQQELALKIMSACPELVAGYWSGAALTLEPRLSSKWIANISFFGSVISLPVPFTSFHLPASTLYQPTPPPLSSIMENMFPSVNTKAHLSKGLQSSSALVQHCTALALAKCLAKYEEVLTLFGRIAAALEESETDGQWCKRRRDVEREVRRRVPDFQVILAFSQLKSEEGKSVSGGANAIKVALLSESGQRLLWMYHRCLPSIVAEARFDVGKLLQNFSLETQEAEINPDSNGQDETPDAAARLHIVRQLHVLRLLKDSDQFVWSGKMGTSSRTCFAVLLTAYAMTEKTAIRVALSDLLQHILSESIMFQEDQDEPQLWLSSLPTIRRAPGAESPDGAPLTDEVDSVVTFLDDCVQRCMKTPHRYIDELNNLEKQPSYQGHGDRLDVDPSPLLMTVLEQLGIKVEKKSLSASNVLALASFLRKLIFRLTTKQHDLQFLISVLTKIDHIFHADRLFPQYPVMSKAIRREVSLLRACLQPAGVTLPPPGSCSSKVQAFLDQIEHIPIPASKNTRLITAFELVDWIRLADEPLGQSEIRRVANVLTAYQSSAFLELAENLNPVQGLLWDGLEIVSRSVEWRKYLQFDSLLLNSTEAQVTDATCRDILAQAAIGNDSTFVNIKRAFRLLTHRLAASHGQDGVTKGLLFLLASIMKHASTTLAAADFLALKESVFVHSEVIKAIFVSDSLSSAVCEGVHQLVEASLDSTSQKDRMMLVDVTNSWMNTLRIRLSSVQIDLVSIWIPYFQPTDLLDILDTFASTEAQSPSTLLLFTSVLTTLQKMIVTESASEVALRERLPQLLSLYHALSNTTLVEELISIAIDAQLPAYYNGETLYRGAFEEMSIVPVIERSSMRWSRHLDPPPSELLSQPFLTQSLWSKSTVNIISGLLYRRLLLKDTFLPWLESEHCAGRSIGHFIPILHAFFDTCSADDTRILPSNTSIWVRQVSRLFKAVTDEDLSCGLRLMGSSCISFILSLISSGLTEFATTMTEMVQLLPTTTMTMEVLILARRLYAESSSDVAHLLTTLVNHGIEWAIRRIADNDDTSLDAIIKELSLVIKVTSGVKTHLVETVMSVIIQNRLSDISALELAVGLLSVVQLKPVSVNRYIQSIIQHPHFFKLCGNTETKPHASRDAIINVLHALFRLHPQNTCHATHVGPLVRVYLGTLATSDGQIMEIFQLFENQQKVSVASLLGRWSSSHLPVSTSLEAIQSLDPILVLRTCLNFPQWRRLGNLSTFKAMPHDAQLYDPIFLILLFSQMLGESPPNSALAWVELFRTNIVSLLIRAMSSKDSRIRDVALCQLTGLWHYLASADMQEKPHVIHILTLLKDVLPSPSEEPPKRLPSYTTLILLHALRGVFYPSNFIYPITARFLLQRPELDTGDVPMLYSMLYSKADNWKKERGWIIRFLSDGMMSTEDWRVLKRRHTWDLLSSLFQSSENDHALRNGIFEVLANLTCNVQAVTSLILKSGLLTWIEMQIITSKGGGVVEWIKIFDNIMVIGNVDKLESSTQGEWRRVICRCLMMLLHPERASVTPGIFPFVTTAILRLSLLAGPLVPELPILLDYALKHLRQLEAVIIIPPAATLATLKRISYPTPFRSHNIHEPYLNSSPLQIWGDAVEVLWRITMILDDKPPAWDLLTSRFLIWRAIIGADYSPVGEWMRTQVVRSIAA